MRIRQLALAGGLALAATACSSDDILTVDPVTVVPASQAITDAISARAAQAGLYDALQSGSYYGESFVTFNDLSSDNAYHSGTFTTYSTADNYQVASDNSTIAGIWTAIYRSINRANVIIAQLPTATFAIDADERDQIVAEAYLVRALGYHNLVRNFGGVPIRTTPTDNPDQARDATRASVTEVYTQILADLQKAQQLMQVDVAGTQGSLGAVRALRARVYLYQGNWAGAEAEADAVTALGYELAPSYSDLFDPAGAATVEDIWRVAFTDQDAGSVSYYYMSKSYGGRLELRPTGPSQGDGNIREAYERNSSGAVLDERYPVTIATDPRGRFFVVKYPSVAGTEHIHVIRYAEVLLIRAEALARQGRLAEAVAQYNVIRERAGLAPHTLGVQVTTQAQVIAAIAKERRLELSFEGDRWPDMIRLGLATAYIAQVNPDANPGQQLYPIPQREIDVAPGLKNAQNPGY